jgi:hypothetical protein
MARCCTVLCYPLMQQKHSAGHKRAPNSGWQAVAYMQTAVWTIQGLKAAALSQTQGTCNLDLLQGLAARVRADWRTKGPDTLLAKQGKDRGRGPQGTTVATGDRGTTVLSGPLVVASSPRSPLRSLAVPHGPLDGPRPLPMHACRLCPAVVKPSTMHDQHV